MQKILIIDDDKDIQDAVRMVLEDHGFNVASAYGPEEGMAKVKSENPDLLILDVLMPTNYEGFDVARKIREELKMKELPILLLTAVHTEKQVPYRFAPHEEYLPVDYFLDKPVKPSVLLEKVNELLNIAG